ncbi:hypothetical protein GLOIN_2v1512563, partial [Rhizophagus irregularis DAOM 181602=DAOM 197198]
MVARNNYNGMQIMNNYISFLVIFESIVIFENKKKKFFDSNVIYSLNPPPIYQNFRFFVYILLKFQCLLVIRLVVWIRTMNKFIQICC